MRTLLALLLLSTALHAEAPSFNRDIRPILSENCFFCHGFDPGQRKAKLRLDTFEGATAERNGSVAITPGNLKESDLWARIISEDADEVMPPAKSHKTLTAAQKQLIKAWIEAGAKYEPHWSFVVPKKPAGTGIDQFIEAKLKANKLSFSTQESPGKLLRRLSLDLTGLPPTLAELDAFESAKDLDKAYEQAVDRMLASRHYGERMAQDWLDAARYADSNGYQNDAIRMNWPWRDWVVKAFNDNKHFDEFTIEQLAGDMLPKPSREQMIATAFNRNHPLNAEGGTIPEENRTKNVFDRVETTSTVWLGLTLQCTQCHDHKFDPLTQRDYYSMYALFNNLSEPGGVDKRFIKKSYSDDYDSLYMLESPFLMLSTPETEKALAAAVKAKDDATKALAARKEEYREPFVKWVLEMRADPELIPKRISQDGLQRIVTNVNLEKLEDGSTRRLLAEFLKHTEPWASLKRDVDVKQKAEDAARGAIPHVMVMKDDKPREAHILLRGNYETPGEKVTAGVPGALPPLTGKVDRLAFAKWLVSKEHPLTARVTVNRYWQQFFGRGLVKTTEDFGVQGAAPSHAELLDWLAVEFQQSGWDVKKLVKLIVMSKTYRQSGVTDAARLAIDPNNELLSHGPRHRLDSRILRDQALALAGLLVETEGGPPVMPYQPPGLWEELSFGKNRYFQGHGDDLYRRSLYTFWRRSLAPANFFDAPARQVCSVKPQLTNTPLHALTTLNDTTIVEAARVWLETLPQDETAWLKQAFRQATGRLCDAKELATLQKALAKARQNYAEHPAEAVKLIEVGEHKHPSRFDDAEHAARATVNLLILNLDETLTK